MLLESYKKGDKRAIYNLGWNYLLGASGIEKDEKKAVEFFKKGALLKDSKCMQALAICYRDGDGTKQDFEQMFYWLKQGSALKDIDCMYHLALAYDQGMGIEKNEQEAIALMQQISKYRKEARNYLKNKGVYESQFKRLFKRKSL